MGQIHPCCYKQFNTSSCWVVFLLYDYTTSADPLTYSDIWVVSSCLSEKSWTFMYKSLYEYMFLFLLSKHFLWVWELNDCILLINCLKLFKSAYTFYNPTISVRKIQLPTLISNCASQPLNINHSNSGVMVSHCSFNVHSLMTNGTEIFPILIFH